MGSIDDNVMAEWMNAPLPANFFLRRCGNVLSVCEENDVKNWKYFFNKR